MSAGVGAGATTAGATAATGAGNGAAAAAGVEAEPVPEARGLVIGLMDERFLLTDNAAAQFRRRGEVFTIARDEELARCDVIGAFFNRKLDRDLLAIARRCALIVHPGSAVLCDVAAASELGIAVVNVPGTNARSVAEHAIALLMDLSKGITASDRAVRAGEPWYVGDRSLQRTELAGKTLGLVGFGKIGKETAQIARDGLRMHVRAWARRPDDVEAAGVEYAADLDALLAESDAISLHVSLNPQTRGILDARRVGLIRPGAWLVNTARANLADSDAVRAALETGRLAGAAYDVWPDDEPSEDWVLLEAPNMVFSQHNAGYTREAADRSLGAMAASIDDVAAGRRPTRTRLVDPAMWDSRRSLPAL